MYMDWFNAFIGGALIGLSATMMLLLNGRIAGISGIFFGSISPKKGEFSWRLAFLIGLLFGGLVVSLLQPNAFINETNRSLWFTIAAGFLVGFGTRLGSGCTSGHGVCGISRFSMRSFIATGSFIVAGVITTFAVNAFIVGG